MLGNRLRILMYHSISHDPNDEWAVSPEAFREQIEWLVANEFKVVPLEKALAMMENRGDLRKSIVLTFDDGYADFLDNAAPILSRHRFPATLFVVMGRVGATSEWSSRGIRRPLLGWDALKNVVDLGYTIGSHTMTHPRLSSLNPNTMAWEVEESLAALKKQIGGDFYPFAYPYGDYTDRVVEEVATAGYHCALTAGGLWGNGYNSHPFLLTREPVMGNWDFQSFRAAMSSHHELTDEGVTWPKAVRPVARIVGRITGVGAGRSVIK
ncbi:MAG: polysaccharide deacetylase family protein [Dehalococcoidia bacterium]|nr:polysaccharide deacetylase family protein [Dehalococcoidia bacterium]